MKILNELLSTLNYEAPVKEICMGPFQSAVRTRYCGLASTPHQEGPHHSQNPVPAAGLLLEKTARDLAGMAKSENIYEATIGMATINSLIEVDEGEGLELNARDLIAEKGKGKNVAIIGHFPFVPQLKKIARELWVIERILREGDHAETEAPDIIPRADVVGITGTSFTNHTIEQLLALCRRDAYVVILGDTTPLSRVLFNYGIDALSGTRVIDYEAALRCIKEGATYRQIKGIRQITILNKK
jgi:uncharacterized protein (DUF4213/DUF364 family)